jgi:hypothetical protein
MMSPRWLLLLICATLPVGPAQAESGDPWYEIELIVFARNDSDSGQTESWPREPGTPNWSNAHTIQPELPPMAEGVVTTPSSITLVPKAGYRLNGAVRELERTAGRLEPLLHLAWRQPVQNRDTAGWLYIESPFHVTGSTGFALPKRLEGAIRIGLSRYLHIDLDLLLRNQAPASANTYAIATSPYRSYRMQDHRRMRSGELHYIDHPLMGVLVEIRPFEAPKPEPEPPAPIVLPRTAAPTAAPMPTPSGAPQPAPPSE